MAVPNPDDNPGLARDCEILLDSANTLEGTLDYPLQWSDKKKIDDWKQVSVSGTPKRVVKLTLAYRGLSGTIPSELGGLDALTVMNFASASSDHRLTGTIPSELGNLSNLEELILSGNALSGELPAELGKLSNLRVLRIENNRLTGDIPSELGNLTNLSFVYLSGNDFTGCLPASWSRRIVRDYSELNLPFCAVSSQPSYLPNVGDLYYNGGDYADAMLRWDNPSWTHQDEGDCADNETNCSTYEHDLKLDWSNDGGWFDIPVAKVGSIYSFFLPDIGPEDIVPGFKILGVVFPYWLTPFPIPVITPIPIYPPIIPPDDLFCTTWSNLPEHYNDCQTAGLLADPGIVELSFGSFKSKDIKAGQDYWGSWEFNEYNVKGLGSSTSVGLYGQEGELEFNLSNILKSPLCLNPVDRQNIWCVFGKYEERIASTNWTYGNSSYLRYSRP